MKVVDVYKQYFAADCMYNTVQRNGAVVTLTAASECGMIKYEVCVSFFPHRNAEDFAVSYDAYAANEIYYAKGRRSKKREELFLKELQEYANAVAAELGGKIFWEKSLTDAQFG